MKNSFSKDLIKKQSDLNGIWSSSRDIPQVQSFRNTCSKRIDPSPERGNRCIQIWRTMRCHKMRTSIRFSHTDREERLVFFSRDSLADNLTAHFCIFFCTQRRELIEPKLEVHECVDI